MIVESIAGLFDVPVAAWTADARTELDPLTDPEAAHVGPRWSEKRLGEFRAGRHCARRALALLGAEPAALQEGLTSDERGVPRWPAGFAGSISHTGRGPTLFAASVVTRSARSLGLDVEGDAALREELRERVLTSEEVRLARLEHHTDHEEGRRALLVFSAKEAFFKCQFPVSRIHLGFHEVEIRFDGPLGAAGVFRADALRDLGPGLPGSSWQGRYARVAGLVLTGVSLLDA